MISVGEVDGQALVAGFVHDTSRGAAELLVLDPDDLAGQASRAGAGPVRPARGVAPGLN